MQYEIQTYRGINFAVELTEELTAFTEKLNSRELRTIAISEIVLNKQNIKGIMPVYGADETPVGTEYDVYTNENVVFKAHMESYNASELSKLINDQSKQFVVIGDLVLNQNNVSMIAPVQSETV